MQQLTKDKMVSWSRKGFEHNYFSPEQWNEIMRTLADIAVEANPGDRAQSPATLPVAAAAGAPAEAGK